MKMRIREKLNTISFSLRIKIIISFYLFNMIVCSVLAISSYFALKNNLMKDLQGRAKNIVTLGSQILDEDAMIYLTGKMSPKLTEKETAAVEMMHTLKEYNQHRQKINYAPVDIGIGIYTGLLMLGTVGEEKRINGSVISEAVNLISRLEGLIKIYKSSIIISKTTMESLSDPKKFNIRFMDKLRVNGKNKPVLI